MGARRYVPARHAGLIAVVVLAASCTDSGALDDPSSAACAGLSADDHRVELGDRSYLQHVPGDHDGATRLPLVVALHGFSEGAPAHAAATGFGPLGDREGFVAVFPHATGEILRWDLRVDGDFFAPLAA